MANSLKSDVWVLDSTGVVTTRDVKIEVIVWENPTTVDDKLVLKNRGGEVILDARCEVNGQSQIYRLTKWFSGLTVDTINSGKAYIYFV